MPNRSRWTAGTVSRPYREAASCVDRVSDDCKRRGGELTALQHCADAPFGDLRLDTGPAAVDRWQGVPPYRETPSRAVVPFWDLRLDPEPVAVDRHQGVPPYSGTVSYVNRVIGDYKHLSVE